MRRDWKDKEFVYVKDKWEYHEATDAQKKYILDLARKRRGYRLIVDLEDLSKGDASRLIQALEEDSNDRLVESRILCKVLTQSEFMEKVLASKKYDSHK